MCGICGWIRPQGVNFHHIVKMNNIASHRGPDGEGYWAWDGKSTFGCFIDGKNPEREASQAVVGVGHKRLAILDLSDAGIQPMSYGNGKLWLVLNGEVYNYLELKQELKVAGYSFSTKTDTEVVLAAYDHWGTGCFSRFNGMWALALIDMRKKSMILSRDRLGVKPLYFWKHEDSFAFASEIKQFFALTAFRPIANMQAVVEYIDTGYENSQVSFFEGVIPFSPGCWGELDLKNPQELRVHPYWFPEQIKVENIGVQPAQENTRLLFEQAVKLRMRSDVPVGVCLSGGLDSSSIFAQCQRYRDDKEGQAFSAAFSDPIFDERPFIQKVIEKHGGSVHYIFPQPEMFLADFDQFLYHHDEPPGSLSQYAGWAVMRLARQYNVPVLLNGQGGDELFSGYWPAYYLFLRQRAISAPWEIVSHVAGSLLPGGNPELVNQMIPHLRQYIYRRRRNNRGLLLRHWRSSGYTLNENWASAAQKLSPSQYRIKEIQEIHLPRLLKWDDRNSMAFGIEGRSPFLDYKLVEWAVSLPSSLNLSRGWNKLLLRQSLGDLLPKEIQWRRSKIGFETPQSEWIRSMLRPILAEWIDKPSDRLKEILDEKRFKKYGTNIILSRTLHKMDERHFLLMRLFFLDRWMDRFDVEIPG